MRVSYAPGYYAPIPHEHIFPMGKFEGLHRYLTEKGLVHSSDVIEPGEVEMSHLLAAHTARYAEGVMSGQLGERELRRLGLPWSPRLARRSRLAVQGTINAAIMALQDGLAGNLAGGTHHARRDGGEGFCVFNDVAVAVRVLQSSMWARRIMVIDCDVHQGNGTAELLAGNPDCYTLSIHGRKNYPFHKPPSTLDVGLPDGTGDRAYHRALGDALDRAFSDFRPDLVFYLGGIDPLESDTLGRLALSLGGLRRRERIVMEKVCGAGVPLVLLLSGGYGPTLRDTVTAHAQMFEVAAGFG